MSSYFEDTGLTYNNPEYYYETNEKGHGRIERRCYQVAYAPRTPEICSWRGIHSIAMVVSETTRNSKPSSQVRYYISSLPPDPKEIARAIRGHWTIENQVHWALDVIFNEDGDMKRKDHAPRNFAAIRKLSLNLIRLYLGKTSGVTNLRMRSMLNSKYFDNMVKTLFLGVSH